MDDKETLQDQSKFHSNPAIRKPILLPSIRLSESDIKEIEEMELRENSQNTEEKEKKKS